MDIKTFRKILFSTSSGTSKEEEESALKALISLPPDLLDKILYLIEKFEKLKLEGFTLSVILKLSESKIDTLYALVDCESFNNDDNKELYVNAINYIISTNEENIDGMQLVVKAYELAKIDIQKYMMAIRTISIYTYEDVSEIAKMLIKPELHDIPISLYENKIVELLMSKYEKEPRTPDANDFCNNLNSILVKLREF